MNYTQNEKILSITERTLVVGLDIGKSTQYARAFDYRGIELSTVMCFENSAYGFKVFEEWIRPLMEQNKKTDITIGMEPTGHYWFNLAHYLKSINARVVLVNPLHVKRSKELDDNSQTKNDRKDPKTIAKLVTEGRYSMPYIPEGIYSDLRIAVDIRDGLNKSLNKISNKIVQWLDKYFPEFNDVFANWGGQAALIALREFPTPEKVLSCGEQKILSSWRMEGNRTGGVKRASRLVEAAKTSIGIKNGLRMAEKELGAILEQYDLYMNQLSEILVEIENLTLQVPGVKEALTIKGIGIITAAGFIAEVGDLSRFSHPSQIQKLAGLNLIENSSGKHKGRTVISKRGRARLRALLFRAIMPLVSKNKEFRMLHEYYITRKNNPLRKMQSLILLCCKLIRIMYTIITRQVEYNPEKLMKDLSCLRQREAA